MALDGVNNRMFIPAYGNGGYRAFQLKEDGLPASRAAQAILSRNSIYGRRSNPLPNQKEAKFPGAITVFDNSTQRLFSIDRFNNRILVYKAGLQETEKFAGATVIIGQPDFNSSIHALGPNRFGLVMSAIIDEENQRLFVADMPNNRVLVFDIDPARLQNDPRAYAVIGQEDFKGRKPGLGPSKLSRPMSVAYDPAYKRLFVSDAGNHRVLVFDADPKNPEGFKKAVAVMGQVDFNSKAPRKSLNEIHAETISYDWRYHRLFIAEDLNHRIMVFDAHPDRVGGRQKAIAVIGQPDAESTHPAVSHNRLAMPRLTLNPDKQKLYVSEGFPAGNRISIWNIAPEKLETGMSAEDVVGHETADGRPDFENRMAQGHLDGRALAAPRDVLLDPVDHRLFVGDEYNHRVVVWQLDELNRIVDYDADWVIGQPDLETSLMGEPNERNLTVPIALTYDKATKRLFVGDGYHNRVMVYEAAPETLHSGMAASVVIGQKDFNSTEKTAGKSGLNFGIQMGRGIASNFIPMGLEVDETGQRLFVSDGKNNRVVIHDIRRDKLVNGAEAIGVIGQDNFEQTAPRADAKGLHDPGHLVFDPQYQRLFVIDSQRKRVLAFDVSKENFANGAEAIAVLGKPDFKTSLSRMPGGSFAALMAGRKPPEVNGHTFVTPNGIAHDPLHQILYIGDGGGTFNIPADRVLAIDVSPDKLPRTGATAFAAVGALNASTPAPRYFGGSGHYPGQFTVRDTRGIDVDPVNGRLYTTGSFESRIVAFHFPRASWQYHIRPGSMQSFGSLDAVDIGFRSDPVTLSSARLGTSRNKPAGMAIYSVSKPFVDERSERHSRILISEAAVAAGNAEKQGTLFLSGDPQRKHRLIIYNGNKRSSYVTLVLRDVKGVEQQRREYQVAGGGQTQLVVEELGDSIGAAASLTWSAKHPVTVTALRETTNARGETILAPVPMALPKKDEGVRIVPLFVNGGGKRSQLVLINPGRDILQGTITFYDDQGRRRNPGTDSDFLGYYIPAYGVRVFDSDGAGPSTVQGYAVVQPKDKALPYAGVLTRTRYGDVWVNESLVSGVHTREAGYAVDMNPTPVRHGEMDSRLVVVNPNSDAAILHVTHNNNNLLSRSIRPGQQIVISLKEAGMQGQGLVSVNSDAPVVVTLQQQVLNFRGELIETTLSPMNHTGVLPYVINGGGHSTEIRLSNRTNKLLTDQIEFHQPTGAPATNIILR